MKFVVKSSPFVDTYLNLYFPQEESRPLTGTVEGNILHTSDGMMYKYKRTCTMYSTYECLLLRTKKGASAGCSQGMQLYPNGNCIPVGPGQHRSDLCYIRSGVKTPNNLVTKVATVKNIKGEMEDLIEKLALDNKAGNTFRKVWKEVLVISEPYILDGIPYIGLTENEARSRFINARSEVNAGTTVVKRCEEIHRPISDDGTGLLQTSSTFYDQTAAKMQQMMVFSCFALMNLFSSGAVSIR